jgi:hypothetical protein
LSKGYLNRLAKTVPDVIETLTAKGIHANRLSFGGAGPVPTRKPTVPTDARSEFLANRAMGDWAEKSLSAALAQAFPAWRVVQYGDTGRIAAGHPDFKQQYIAGLEETRLRGKRPDLLLFQNDFDVVSDLSEIPQAETDDVVSNAIAAVEVRSSKFEALTYMRVRKNQRAAGSSTGRETQNFTVKVEDLVIVYRWLERHQVPQAYCQVFFDSIFAINVFDVFRTIASGTGYCIETPAKSQEKATIMIPVTAGAQVAAATAPPEFRAEHRVTALGRHDAYVVPEGGGFTIDATKMREVLIGPNAG